MPLPLVNDVVTRIVNVSWGEGELFAIATEDSGATDNTNTAENARQLSSSDGEQNWGYVVEDGAVEECAVDADGNCIIVGRKFAEEPEGEFLVFVRKLSEDGDEMWVFETEDPNDLSPEVHATTDSGGNILISYQIPIATVSRAVVRKFTPAGSSPSETVLSDAFRSPRDIETDGQDNYYLAYTGSDDDGRITKFSPLGSELWTQTLQGGAGIAIAVDDEDNVYALGGTTDSVIHKFSSGGLPLWTRDGPEQGIPNTRRKLASDGTAIYVSGYGVVEKFDKNGTKLWSVEAPKADEDIDVRSQPVHLTDITATIDGCFVGGQGWDHVEGEGADQVAMLSLLNSDNGAVEWTIELDIETDKSLTIIANEASWLALATTPTHKSGAA